MSGHTPRSLPLHGAVPLEARQVWARLAKGRGRAGFCLWPVGLLSRSGPLPLEDLSGYFQRPGCKLSPAVPASRTLCSQAQEKSASGWFSLKALAPESGDQLGCPHSQAKAEPHAHVCSWPLQLQRARLSQSLSGSSLAAPAALPEWEGAELT